jgi:DNA-binding XRE family transcriptional regulator
MKTSKRQRLRKAGYRVGSAGELLGLTPQEEALIEMKLNLVDGVKKLRAKHRFSQAELAKQLGSSQSRVAKLEAGDPSVSIDLLLRALLTLGSSRRQIANIVAMSARRRSAA